MSQYYLSPLAEADLEALLDYIAADKPEAALSFVQRIRQTCETLARNPLRGELRPDLHSPGIRSFSVGNYVVYFRPAADGVEVARVVHGSRDFGNLTIE